MVGGDGVSDVEQAVCILDALDLREVLGEAFEERRVVYVGALGLPLLAVGVGCLEGVPAVGSL